MKKNDYSWWGGKTDPTTDKTELREIWESIKQGGPVPNHWYINGVHYRRVLNRLANYSAGDEVKDKDGNTIGIAAKDSTWRDNFIVVLDKSGDDD